MTARRTEICPPARVDLSDDVCPMAFVRAKLQLERLGRGEVLTIIISGDDQLRDLAKSLKDEGHTIEGVQCDGSRCRLAVRKGG